MEITLGPLVMILGMCGSFLVGWGALWARLSVLERLVVKVESHERRLTRIEQAHADRSGDKCALKTSDS